MSADAGLAAILECVERAAKLLRDPEVREKLLDDAEARHELANAAHGVSLEVHKLMGLAKRRASGGTG